MTKKLEDLTNAEFAAMSGEDRNKLADKAEDQTADKADDAAEEGKGEADGDQEADGSDEHDQSGVSGTDGDRTTSASKVEGKPDNSTYARMRRLEKERDEYRKKAEEKTKEPPKTDPDAEPDREADLVAWYTWKDRQYQTEISGLKDQLKDQGEFIKSQRERENQTQAKRELAMIEADFKRSAPDYDDAIQHLSNSLAFGIRALNPNMSFHEIKEEVDSRGLAMAADAYRAGNNPAEYLYKLAKDHYGFDPSKVAVDIEEVKEEKPQKKPDLKVVADAKKRSASPLGTGGKPGSAQLTAEAALNLTAAEFQALPDSEKKRLMGRS